MLARAYLAFGALVLAGYSYAGLTGKEFGSSRPTAASARPTTRHSSGGYWLRHSYGGGSSSGGWSGFGGGK